jgi:hypothetical protein
VREPTLGISPTEGFAVPLHNEHSPGSHIPNASIPELEVDQTIAPRPEEEIADVSRAKPDVEDHSAHRVKPPSVSGTQKPAN